MYFDEAKATHLVAYLLHLRGENMSYLKLMKMLYLADRKALDLTGEYISGDKHYSMKLGPVLSQTYELINGARESYIWNEWVQPERNYELSLKKANLAREDFDELSEFDIEILEQVFKEFGHYTRWELVDYTHENLPEWQNTDFAAIPIDPKTQFIALGRTPEQAETLRDTLYEHSALRGYLSELH